MTRYIDADELFNKLGEIKPRNEEHYKSIGEFMNLITDSPTADVVEVVRCKDCRYFKKIVERSDSGLCHRDIVASAWKENGYCSRGERKER